MKAWHGFCAATTSCISVDQTWNGIPRSRNCAPNSILLYDNISTNWHIHRTDPLDRAVMQPDMSGCVVDQHLAQLSPAIARPNPPSRAKPNFKHLGSLGRFDSGSGTPQIPWVMFIPTGTYVNIWSMHTTSCWLHNSKSPLNRIILFFFLGGVSIPIVNLDQISGI